MRSLRLVLSDELISPGPSVTRGALLNMTCLSDGSLVELYRFEGDPEALIAECEQNPLVLEYELLETDGRQYDLYAHEKPDEQVAQLLSFLEMYKFILEFPIRFDEDGCTIRVTGRPNRLQQAAREIPAVIGDHIRIEQVGDYTLHSNDALSVLTNRQREALAVAVEVGYYDIPRRATAADVADALGCAPSTASEHLRKIEAHILSYLAR